MASAPSLESTFDSIVKECGRIRLLVVGKTGVGKTSLIKSVFKVTSLYASHDTRGETDIHQEILSPENDYFVVHDSKGYEPGDESIFQELQNFVESRSKSQSLPEKIHVLWLCIRIPTHGGRVIETGTEKVIELCKHHDIPVVIVFTQFDTLLAAVQAKLDKRAFKNGEDPPSSDYCRQVAKVQFEDTCIKSLPPYASELDHVRVWVATEEPVDDSLQSLSNPLLELVEITQQRVQGHYTPLIMAVAQRVDYDNKIRLSIKIGKKKYWKALAASIYFPGHKLEDCLRVLHKDIVKPWNFLDPHPDKAFRSPSLLMSDGFRHTIEHLVDGSMYENDAWQRFLRIAGLAGSIAGIAGGVAGPAAVIVGPITFAAALTVTWLFESYRKSDKHVEYLMGYIVHLIMILYRLPREYVELTEGDVDTAIYAWGSVAPRVQSDIRSFIQYDFKSKTNRDRVIEEISRIIERYKVDAEQCSM